jgi:hypothetical protein
MYGSYLSSYDVISRNVAQLFSTSGCIVPSTWARIDYYSVARAWPRAYTGHTVNTGAVPSTYYCMARVVVCRLDLCLKMHALRVVTATYIHCTKQHARLLSALSASLCGQVIVTYWSQALLWLLVRGTGRQSVRRHVCALTSVGLG